MTDQKVDNKVERKSEWCIDCNKLMYFRCDFCDVFNYDCYGWMNTKTKKCLCPICIHTRSNEIEVEIKEVTWYYLNHVQALSDNGHVCFKKLSQNKWKQCHQPSAEEYQQMLRGADLSPKADPTPTAPPSPYPFPVKPVDTSVKTTELVGDLLSKSPTKTQQEKE
jgi:hypothetical protein